ncbi:DUF2528 family protein [Pseudomonas sp. PS01297]|uniref:DUF2528 family protein n=1 Tax=Pseudomonas sp. PS01297 TaxID=2991433 RepID=UPI00249AEA0B|nr:DUF2528 family protein [Pseudomonas sp. PS01297]
MSTVTADQTVIKRYVVKEVWKDYEVTLEVNHARLTPEVATMINSFWSDHKSRLQITNGDVVKAVIRLFGQTMIRLMLSEGGSSFSIDTGKRDPFGQPGPVWTEDLHEEEGWGGSIKGDPYGFCGIRVIAADVEAPGFDDVELAEVGQ